MIFCIIYSHAWINCNWILKPIKDEIEAFKKMKRLRPSRANFVDAFRWNAVLKRKTRKWGGKFIIIERFFHW